MRVKEAGFIDIQAGKRGSLVIIAPGVKLTQAMQPGAVVDVVVRPKGARPCLAVAASVSAPSAVKGQPAKPSKRTESVLHLTVSEAQATEYGGRVIVKRDGHMRIEVEAEAELEIVERAKAPALAPAVDKPDAPA